MSRSPSRRVAPAALGLAVVAALAAGGAVRAQDAPVPPTDLELVLPVEELALATASLDGAVATVESPARVRVTLATRPLFPPRRTRLRPAAGARLEEVVALIQARRPDAVLVEGHDEDFDRSRRRARAVGDALGAALGEQGPAVRVRGRGDTEPVSTDPELDERVEIAF